MQGLSSSKHALNVINISTEVRLMLTVIMSIACIALSNFWALMILFAASSAYVLMEVKLNTIIKAYIIFAAFAVFATAYLEILFSLVPVLAETTTKVSVIIPFERLAVMMNMLLATSIKSSFAGIANSLNARIVPGSIRLAMIVMIRFIPIFFNDLAQLREAINIRFAGKTGFRYWLRNPRLWMRIFFVPLVVRLIRSGDELAVAAELKGLSANTSLGKANFQLTRADRLSFAVLMLCIVLAVITQRILK